jgi:hypothetical protein
VAEMHSGIQQFLYANTNHNFPLVAGPIRSTRTDHPAEHGIEFSVVVATRADTAQDV